MKLTITKFLIFGIMVSSLMGCGSFSDDTTIAVQMYGVAKAPEGALGDRDPQFQTYELQSITLNSVSGDIVLLDTATSFKIVDRPQILLSKLADDYVDQTYTGMTVLFSAGVTGGDNTEGELSFNLTRPLVTLVENITIEQSKVKTFLIKASWANTLTTGAMTEPTLEISSQ